MDLDKMEDIVEALKKLPPVKWTEKERKLLEAFSTKVTAKVLQQGVD